MRNLKRALSLALSTVMLVGMMAVGTSAASYADVDSADNVEAIEVMKAVSVMVGDENGNFNPDKNVTRAEMAVVMANLLDLQVEDFVGASIPFTDVPEWAHSFVAACYADGITGGVSATQYGSNYSVTATQAALMMLKALGYFQYGSDFGTDWQVATIKQASNIGLFDGIDSARNAAMTRNEVAQIALNALESTLVEPDGTPGNITTSDGTVINLGSVTYKDRQSSNEKYKAISSEKGSDSVSFIGENAASNLSILNTVDKPGAKPGEELCYTLTITNNGESKLTIHKVTTENRPLQVKLKRHTINPGKSAELTIVVDPSLARTNLLNCRVMLITDDPSRPSVPIRVLGSFE